MRIISKHHDYYDSARAWRDDELVYVRQTSEPVKLVDVPALRAAMGDIAALMDAMPNCAFARAHVVAFCGKLYPCWVTHEGETYYSTQQMEKAFRAKPRDAYSISVPYKDRVAILCKTPKKKRRWYPYWRAELTHDTWARFVTDHATKLAIGAAPFRFVKAPVFEVGSVSAGRYSTRRELVINPCLRDRSFVTQVDPYTAFQELGMFLGNDLVDQMDPDLKRSDDAVRDSKGMDKWSFRKMGKNSKR